MSRTHSHAGVKILTLLAVLFVVGLAAQTPPAPAPAAVEAKLPAIPEVTSLKIQNAALRANMALATLKATPAWMTYQAQVDAAEKVIKAEVAAFEVAFHGFTLDTQKMVAVVKPEPPKGK